MTYRDITVAQPWHIQPFLEKKKKKKTVYWNDLYF